MKQLSPESLYKLRCLRKARRLWKSVPMLAYAIMCDDYPGYTYEHFLSDLRPKGKRKTKSKCGKNPLQRYGRYTRMQQLVQDYYCTKALEPLIQASKLKARMALPYQMEIAISGECRRYQFSPRISLADMEQLNEAIEKCATASEADRLYEDFCNTHFSH